MKILASFIIGLFILGAHAVYGASAPDLENQTREVATELRCVVCQNLSVADSPSAMAQEMRDIIRQQLAAGKTPQQIKDYFVSKYGEWVLLAPATKGFSLLVWVLPFIVLIAGLAIGVMLLRSWTKRKKTGESKVIDAALLARVRTEASAEGGPSLDLEDTSERSSLLQERARLYADLKELEFDYQAGKLSEADYTNLRGDIEVKAATVLEQLDHVSKTASKKKSGEPSAAVQPAQATTGKDRPGVRGWQLAAGGAFLLIFGVTVGVLLTNSLRSRDAGQGSITGDFLTGTPGAGADQVASVLEQAKAAFSKQDWPKAIEGFQKVLAEDPNQPEAHAYMGAILLQAGHSDGALMAFDKALSQNPDFPMALWGKGMALYQGKKDFAGARQVFEKLLQLLPPGDDRNQIQKVLAEIPQAGGKPQEVAEAKGASAPVAAGSTDEISGKITIDPKLKNKADGQAALFIIARPAGSGGGPPAAVKKIERPTFPLTYSLGSENAMMQGVPLSGKLDVSVRLDKDGNPMTHQPGDMTGDYKKNPVAVGSHNVDIVIDQLAQ